MASKLRALSLLHYFVITVLGLGVSVWLASVPRAPLPVEEIQRLSNLSSPERLRSLWSKEILEIRADSSEEAQHFTDALSKALSGVTVRVAPRAFEEADGTCLQADSLACLEALEASPGSLDLDSPFELVLTHSEGNALILGTGRRGYLRWNRGSSLQELASSTASLLKESWFRRAALAKSSLFEVTPAYAFSFFLLGDCASRVSWDFHGTVLVPYLRRLLAKLQLLFRVDWNSQVVLCGSLGTSLEPSESNGSQSLDVSVLKADFMRRTGEWPPDALTRDARWLPPLVRFVAFKATDVLLVDEEGTSQHSFAVQGFGAVAIASCETGASNGSLSDCEAQRVASGWISSVRSWLSLPANESARGLHGELELLAARPRIDGIADWELRILARAVHAHFVQRTVETLQNLVELVESLPDVVVREEIGTMAYEAFKKTSSSMDAAARGDAATALAESRDALLLALTAIHDDSVVSQLYFSWEFKYAVYLPISMPVVVPLLTSVWRLFLELLSFAKRARR